MSVVLRAGADPAVQDGSTRFTVSDDRVTDIKAAQAAVSELSRQLLTLQEEERQRIAIELHDSTAQHLIAIELNLMNLRRKIATHEDVEATLSDMELSVREAQKEIRIFSYLLHPPHLEIDGLKSTMERFIDGFSRRSGLNAQVSIALAVNHLPIDLQRCLLRVVQEALANVHRHAEAKEVVVRLLLEGETLSLRIKDDGKGIPAEELSAQLVAGPHADRAGPIPLGLGLPGMLARLQQFGGTLELVRDVNGTEIEATIPLPSERGRGRKVKIAPTSSTVDHGSRR